MTTSPGGTFIPTWTTGDRLRKARETTALTTRAFAELIGVSQKTVTDAENDRREPRKIVVNAWSLATGVPVEWLRTGAAPGPSPTPGPAGELPRLDSNQQPSASQSMQVSTLRRVA